MNPEEMNDEESPSTVGEMSLKFKSHSEIQRMIEEAKSDSELEKIINELQLEKAEHERAQESGTVPLGIQEETVELFVDEKVGHSCDLCQIDLANDPQRPNATLYTLQEACVLACGHVFHFKCLQATTLDLDNGSTDPSCILCIT